MKITDKLAYAKTLIDSIVSHDDAPAEEVANAVEELRNHAAAGLLEAADRRRAAAAAAAEVQ